MPIATASQTIGPYWHLIEDPSWSDLTRFGAQGEAIALTGTLADGAGAKVSDAAVEIWQSSPTADDRFSGYGRTKTDAQGGFQFRTLKPGPAPGVGNALQAPHIAIVISARGLLRALTTRLYFAGEPLNETDPVLVSIEDPATRQTLIAHPSGPAAWHLDIRLQGENETVFMEI
ncbi:MAG TPA: protocatechuate 3,4-dioxygenase subunit alpha [Rhodopila sp.]|nr:protocatechuate 3,4-dioxygenase subunit alpha [Rhodopila sp.]